MHGGGHGIRLGCEFIELDGQAQRTLQRYIDHTQQRRRLLALR
jgi:c-di-GMP-binding flagellar brake protein YcgR